MTKSMIRHHGYIMKLLHCDRTCEMTCGKPFLYA
uniref:Uncharacterized protein n=1 Tax=Rhizophora mucronata TaxID=61149 RepID=A0A2P2N4N8_RHIMU